MPLVNAGQTWIFSALDGLILCICKRPRTHRRQPHDPYRTLARSVASTRNPDPGLAPTTTYSARLVEAAHAASTTKRAITSHALGFSQHSGRRDYCHQHYLGVIFSATNLGGGAKDSSDEASDKYNNSDFNDCSRFAGQSSKLPLQPIR
ncbi:hypothetical protein [Amycolatopsis sp. FDAARGOS 1241]|uniref:hypothetical protein n=1 Tax=Amycolatopsis sp. FDAARGOS 1241 TaxID=2778070 RepID=UPI00195028B7|nr:hypothetical protein [Amycolatopsis sp. FDAARGOS 1241]QRP45131.1 hypothetical protein I6J71_39105 [Amycolatopsis sp. FDAARGOS 1241]